MNVLVIAFLGVLCGCEGWDDLAAFGLQKQEFLSTFLVLGDRPPCSDTYRRVFERIRPAVLEPIFRNLARHLVKVLEGKALAIDGKTMRHSFDKATGQSALHQVHAWIVQEGVLLGQVATDSKSNEITAIPQLLSLLDVRGTDVSIDAMGCQKDIAKQLVDQGANYVLGLKENHPTLYAEVDALFDHPLLAQNTSQPVFEYQEENKGHGRQEKRIVRAISSDGLSGQEGWKGLKTVVRVESHRTIDNRKTVEFRYYLSSIAANEVERISRRIRGHWTVENSLHWSLDVQMREDESRIRMGHGAENFGILRRLALIILKHDKTIKRGLKAKQKIAGWNNDTLLRFMISEIP